MRSTDDTILSTPAQLAREWRMYEAVEAGEADALYATWEAPAPVVVVGRGNRLDDWVRAERCRLDGIEVLRRCYPERAEDELTSAAYAMIGLLLSIAHWPREARTTARLESLLESLVVGGLSALEDRPHDANGQVPAVSTSAAGRASARRRS